MCQKYFKKAYLSFFFCKTIIVTESVVFDTWAARLCSGKPDVDVFNRYSKGDLFKQWKKKYFSRFKENQGYFTNNERIVLLLEK